MPSGDPKGSVFRIAMETVTWRCASVVVLVLVGCTPPKVAGPVLPIHQAIGIVEANRRLVTTGLKARGAARGSFLDDHGARHHFDLEAKLQILPPDHLRFTLEHIFAGREVEVGMNSDKWWVLVRRPVERYHEGRRGSTEVSLYGTVPLRAERLMECVGLGDPAAGLAAPRVTDDSQQLIFVRDATDGSLSIQREYWLDRYEPRLVRRVLFRDGDGRVTLSSDLDNYRAVNDAGLQLPHRLRLTWPIGGAELTFHVDRWRIDPRLGTEHRAFVSPWDRGERFDHESITQE